VAIKAIRKGAYHYITKPINADELLKASKPVSSMWMNCMEDTLSEGPSPQSQPLILPS
jgi:ActR/RegA family two-component response regulator